MNIVSSKEVLLTAYGNIKSNKGSTTIPGTQNQTSDQMSDEHIENLSKQLKNNTYVFPDIQRIWIPKPIKGVDWKKKENFINKGRPLGVPDFAAKLIQEAVRLVLSAIYEPLFENQQVSFGFRPKLGCQNAIAIMKKKVQGMGFAIEGNIKDAYNNLNHHKLIKILSKNIQDKPFLNLIYKMCKSGVFDSLQKIRTDSLLGVPQGGIVSPLLWNIYMHEFDKYVNYELLGLINIINTKQKRNPSVGNPKYKSLISKKEIRVIHREKFLEMNKNPRTRIKERQYNHNRRLIAPSQSTKKYTRPTHWICRWIETEKIRLSKLKTASPETTRLWARNISKMYGILAKVYIKKRQRIPSKDERRINLRICYIRYADDWILFCNGKRTLAQYFKNKIRSFLKYELGLTLSEEKTKITKLTTEPAKFLGYEIKMDKTRKDKNNRQRRVGRNTPVIGVDKARLKERMEWRGYLKKGKPREQPAWSTLTDYEIVSKYNAVIRELVNYYAAIISYKSTLNYYVYILEYSCYKTLCQKHRTTVKKLIRKNGIPLKVERPKKDDGTIELLSVRTYAKVLKEPINKMAANFKKGKSNQDLI